MRQQVSWDRDGWRRSSWGSSGWGPSRRSCCWPPSCRPPSSQLAWRSSTTWPSGSPSIVSSSGILGHLAWEHNWSSLFQLVGLPGYTGYQRPEELASLYRWIIGILVFMNMGMQTMIMMMFIWYHGWLVFQYDEHQHHAAKHPRSSPPQKNGQFSTHFQIFFCWKLRSFNIIFCD